jgi:hypothetical protein
MLKRIAITALVGAALFGAVSSGMLARHRELRKSAAELLRLDVEILVGD